MKICDNGGTVRLKQLLQIYQNVNGDSVRCDENYFFFSETLRRLLNMENSCCAVGCRLSSISVGAMI